MVTHEERKPIHSVVYDDSTCEVCWHEQMQPVPLAASFPFLHGAFFYSIECRSWRLCEAHASMCEGFGAIGEGECDLCQVEREKPRLVSRGLCGICLQEPMNLYAYDEMEICRNCIKDKGGAVLSPVEYVLNYLPLTEA